MERVESIKKQKGIFEILTSKKAKYVMGTILLSGLGVVLPRIFHVLAGSSAGATFLPMHLAVLIATFTLGTISGSIVAGTSIVLSYVLTGMPTLDRLPYMLIELLLYVILVGIFKKKFNFYISFIFRKNFVCRYLMGSNALDGIANLWNFSNGKLTSRNARNFDSTFMCSIY